MFIHDECDYLCYGMNVVKLKKKTTRVTTRIVFLTAPTGTVHVKTKKLQIICLPFRTKLYFNTF